VVHCYVVLEDCTATNFRVTGLVAVNAEAFVGIHCVSYMGQFEGVQAVSAVEVVQGQQDCPKAVYK
jgi:hypothetical protein